jgi:hypothetical protein
MTAVAVIFLYDNFRAYAKLFQLGIKTFGAGEASQAWDARYVGRQYIV